MPGAEDMPNHSWFDRQHSIVGTWCCSLSDGHILEDDDWRATDGHYTARIQGVWYPIPDDALRDPAGGPNPTGKAIVWYLIIGPHVNVFCFAPGTML
jgi:hypothetical protein